jgi:tetratricopeptide (TPR) repeat protein
VAHTSTTAPTAHHDAAVSPAAHVDDAAMPDGGREAARLVDDAMQAVQRSDFPAAMRLFALAYERVPSLELAFNTFRMCERSAAVPEGEQWYARTLSHNPPPAVRADLDQRIAALRDFARRRRDDIARPPPGTDVLAREANEWFTRGVGLYQRRQYAPALDAFEAALRYAQESRREVAELYFNLAVTHEHLGHRAEAAAAFREYLSRRPDTPDRGTVEDRVRRLSQ